MSPVRALSVRDHSDADLNVLIVTSFCVSALAVALILEENGTRTTKLKILCIAIYGISPFRTSPCLTPYQRTAIVLKILTQCNIATDASSVCPAPVT
jgi:hypothetical protein